MNSPDDIVQAAIDGQMLSVPRWMADLAQQPPITLTIDGKKVRSTTFRSRPAPEQAVPRFTTIYDAGESGANRRPHSVPPRTHAAGGRVPGLSVQVGFEGRPAEWRLAPACYRPIEPGMIVDTHHTNDRVRVLGQVLTELLLADHPTPCAKHKAHGDCELEVWPTSWS